MCLSLILILVCIWELICIWSNSRMQSDGSAWGQSELLHALYKYSYLSNASFVCDGIFTIYRQNNIIFFFSDFIPVRKNLPPNFNKGFIEPPCTSNFKPRLQTLCFLYIFYEPPCTSNFKHCVFCTFLWLILNTV